jgi:hypothetical protein
MNQIPRRKVRNTQIKKETMLKDTKNSCKTISTYNNHDFERQFQLRKELFLRIAADVMDASPYYVQKPVCSFCVFLCNLSEKKKLIEND